MLFSKKHKGEQNIGKLLSICNELIDYYEKDSTNSSCKDDLMSYVKQLVELSKSEILQWEVPNDEYVRVAHTIFANGTFDLLTSGKYHIHIGQLNPMSCAPNLMSIYNKSMEYAVENKLLEESEKRKNTEYLFERIKQVG